MLCLRSKICLIWTRQTAGGSSQNIFIAVCVSYLKETICKSLIGVYTFTGYSDYKDVLYCDISDRCCHRLEPRCSALSDIFPLCVTTEGTIPSKSWNIHLTFISPWIPQKVSFFERAALQPWVCLWLHIYVVLSLTKYVSYSRVREQWAVTHSKPLIDLSSSFIFIWWYWWYYMSAL